MYDRISRYIKRGLTSMAESKPYKVYRSERKRFVTIPDALADQIGVKQGSFITWELRDNTLILRKARE